MSEHENAKQTGIVEALTPEEQRALFHALSKIESSLFEAVLKRLKNWVMLIAAAFTAFGIASIATIRAAIVEAAAEKIENSSGIKEEVVIETSNRLQRVNKVLREADSLHTQVDAERARAATTINADLEEILQMVTQIRNELTDTASSSSPD